MAAHHNSKTEVASDRTVDTSGHSVKRESSVGADSNCREVTGGNPTSDKINTTRNLISTNSTLRVENYISNNANATSDSSNTNSHHSAQSSLLIDSACNRHLCNDKKLLFDIRNCPAVSIRVANGNRSAATKSEQ